MGNIYFLLAFTSFNIFSQNLQKLDEKSSFKTIKLESTSEEIDKLHSIPELRKFNKEGLGTIYVCKLENNQKNKNLFNLFDIKIDEVMLIFDKDQKLSSIHLTKRYPKSNGLDVFEGAVNTNLELFKRFATLYGTVFIKDNGDNESKTYVGNSWVGKKTVLDLSTTYYKDNNETELTVIMTSKEYAEKLEQNGF